jgi:hypothetical protein
MHPASDMRPSGVRSGWWLAAALWVGVAGAAFGPSGCDAGPSAEQCRGDDDDQDGKIDCADDDCWIAGGTCPEVCTTVFDEDGDGFDGCEDPDCWLAGGVCAENCDEAGDEDADGVEGCADPDCWVSAGGCDEVCGSGNDEDGDGQIDCEDAACWIAGAGCPEICSGADDEDADGDVDCDDVDCADDAACIPTFSQDVQPIFLRHCSGNGMCHSNTLALGGLNFESYDSVILPSIYCPMMNKAQCALFRIYEPSMPPNCFGCVPQGDIDVIQAWLDAGFPP